MLALIAAIAALLWLLGFSVHLGGGLVHLLLLVALVVFVCDILTRGRSTIQ